MNQKTKTEICDELKEVLQRDPKLNEELNAQTDALILARVCIKRIELIEEEIKLLKQK
mgnify:FL=1